MAVLMCCVGLSDFCCMNGDCVVFQNGSARVLAFLMFVVCMMVYFPNGPFLMLVVRP